MSAPCIKYIGGEWGTEYKEELQMDSHTGKATRVRTIGDDDTLARAVEGSGTEVEILESECTRVILCQCTLVTISKRILFTISQCRPFTKLH